MLTSAVPSRPRGLRLPPWWLAGSLGVLLAGLWVMQIHPPAGGLFAPFTVLTAQLTAFMLAAIGLILVFITVAFILIGFRLMGRDFMLRRAAA